MAAATKKLVVCGGSGFLGARICKFGVQRGWEVTSLSADVDSRSGEPQWSNVTGTPTPPSWARRVAWERADVFRPETYSPLFRGANYAVHSMGILLEADYKGLLSGKDSPLAGLRKIVTGTAPAASSPSSSSPNEASPPLTYESMNRDSALLAARAAADAGVDAFAYISAAGGAPVLPDRYLSSKRDAERQLLKAAAVAASPAESSSSAASVSTTPLRRPVLVRAPFMYDGTARPVSLPLAALVSAGSLFNRATGGVLGGFLGTGGIKPMSVDEVAQAVVEALSDDSVQGVLEVPQISELSQQAWRKGML